MIMSIKDAQVKLLYIGEDSRRRGSRRGSGAGSRTSRPFATAAPATTSEASPLKIGQPPLPIPALREDAE